MDIQTNLEIYQYKYFKHWDWNNKAKPWFLIITAIQLAHCKAAKSAIGSQKCVECWLQAAGYMMQYVKFKMPHVGFKM